MRSPVERERRVGDGAGRAVASRCARVHLFVFREHARWARGGGSIWMGEVDSFPVCAHTAAD